MTNLERRIIRYRLMDQHRTLVRAGSYGVAELVLRLLRRGHVSLGLWDDAWEAEQVLTAAGLNPHYSRNGNLAMFYLAKEGC